MDRYGPSVLYHLRVHQIPGVWPFIAFIVFMIAGALLCAN